MDDGRRRAGPGRGIPCLRRCRGHDGHRDPVCQRRRRRDADTPRGRELYLPHGRRLVRRVARRLERLGGAGRRLPGAAVRHPDRRALYRRAHRVRRDVHRQHDRQDSPLRGPAGVLLHPAIERLRPVLGTVRRLLPRPERAAASRRDASLRDRRGRGPVHQRRRETDLRRPRLPVRRRVRRAARVHPRRRPVRDRHLVQVERPVPVHGRMLRHRPYPRRLPRCQHRRAGGLRPLHRERGVGVSPAGGAVRRRRRRRGHLLGRRRDGRRLVEDRHQRPACPPRPRPDRRPAHPAFRRAVPRRVLRPRHRLRGPAGRPALPGPRRRRAAARRLPRHRRRQRDTQPDPA